MSDLRRILAAAVLFFTGCHASQNSTINETQVIAGIIAPSDVAAAIFYNSSLGHGPNETCKFTCRNIPSFHPVEASIECSG